jgi:hypothetical protein
MAGGVAANGPAVSQLGIRGSVCGGGGFWLTHDATCFCNWALSAPIGGIFLLEGIYLWHQEREGGKVGCSQFPDPANGGDLFLGIQLIVG